MLLSIITVNLNNSIGLEKTIKSVKSQSKMDFEFIVIDGGSIDGSVNVIKKHNNILKYWVSEPDNGIYHAMNKGILKANGQYCLFLNAGDTFINEGILEKINNESLTEDIINFNAIVEDGEDKILVKSKGSVTFYDFYKHTILHQATFINRALFSKYGLYNEDLKIVSDWEFFIKVFFIFNCSYKSVPIILSVYEGNGISSLPENQKIGLREREVVLNLHFKRFLPDYNLLSNDVTFQYLKILKRNHFMETLFLIRAKIVKKIYDLLEKNN